jgi:hypothetical protein
VAVEVRALAVTGLEAAEEEVGMVVAAAVGEAVAYGEVVVED